MHQAQRLEKRQALSELALAQATCSELSLLGARGFSGN